MAAASIRCVMIGDAVCGIPQVISHLVDRTVVETEGKKILLAITKKKQLILILQLDHFNVVVNIQIFISGMQQQFL